MRNLSKSYKANLYNEMLKKDNIPSFVHYDTEHISTLSNSNSHNNSTNSEAQNFYTDTPNLHSNLDYKSYFSKLISTILQFQIQLIKSLFFQANMLILITFTWFLILSLIVFFSFISPWPIFLPSIFLSFTLGYLSSSLSDSFTRSLDLSRRGVDILTYLDNTFSNSEILSTELVMDPLTNTENTKEQEIYIPNSSIENNKLTIKSKTEPSPSTYKLSQSFQSTLKNENNSFINVPLTSSPYPFFSEWITPPLYIRFVEQQWVLDELRKQFLSKDFNYKQSLNYTVNYPSEALKIKSISEDESEYINDFETPFFKGKILIRISNLKNHTDEDYFFGKKRSSQTCIQGKFKYPFKFSEVLTGQIFDYPFSNLPPFWLTRLGFLIIKRLSPNMHVELTSQSPYALSPLISALQSVHIADEKSIIHPDISLKEIPEETSLLGGYFSENKISRHERRSFFREIKKLNNYRFNTEYTYTMDTYQHIFFPSTYDFNVGIYNFDISPYLNGQAIETMAVIDSELFNLDDEVDDIQNQSFDNNINQRQKSINNNCLNSSKKIVNNFLEILKNSIDKDDMQPKKRIYLWRIQLMHKKLLDK